MNTIVGACCLMLLGAEGSIAKPTTMGEQVSPVVRVRPHLPPGSSTQPIPVGSRGSRVAEVAPNGDVFVADGQLNTVAVLHIPAGGAGSVQHQVFARGLRRPFGIAFYPAGADPSWIYVASLDGVVRFAYKNGDLKASADPELVVSGMPTTHYARLEQSGKTGELAAGPQNCEGMTVQPATGELWCIAGEADESGFAAPGDASPSEASRLDLQPL